MEVKTNLNPKPSQATCHPVLDSIRFSPIATVVSDPTKPDNPLIAVKEAFCALTGYAKDEVIGRNCRFLRGPDTENGQTEKLRSAVYAQHPALAELINYRKDGSPFRNAVMIAPLIKRDSSAASNKSKPSRSSGIPTRLRGSMSTNFLPASL